MHEGFICVCDRVDRQAGRHLCVVFRDLSGLKDSGLISKLTCCLLIMVVVVLFGRGYEPSVSLVVLILDVLRVTRIHDKTEREPQGWCRT